MRQSNVTVEGYELATPSAEAKISEVIDLDEGITPKANALIASTFYQNLVSDRVKIVERMNSDAPRYLCALCLNPVYLASTPEKHFFFRHQSEHEDSCSAKTRSELTAAEITARKYHGLRESEPHKRIKALIERSLVADPAFSGIVAERNWKSLKDSKRFRRPDVQAATVLGKFAFEVQLSTTFLSVVAGRRAFYREEGGLLIWIFGAFDPEYRRLTTDDILYSNNSNIFIVDEETAIISEKEKAFHLKCHHRVPVRKGNKLDDEWRVQIVPFRDLTQDRDNQRTYLFNFEGAEQDILAAIRRDAEDAKAMAVRRDQVDLFEFWKEHGRFFRHTSENHAVWQQLRDRFERRDIALPVFPDSDELIRVMLCALCSARAGKPIGYNFNILLQVAHQVVQTHPSLFIPFYSAVEAYGHAELLKTQDESGKWHKKLKGVQNGEITEDGIFARIKLDDPLLRPEPKILPLMNFLFPEIADRVSKALSRH